MASESTGDRPAQCSVPNITFSTESSNISSLSGGLTTPNTPVLLLAKPRNPQSSGSNPQESQRTGGDMAPVSLLQRPLSAPTSLESSSSHGSSALKQATGNQPEPTEVDVDASIVEALKSSKDRLYVLKLGETMESLISQATLYAKVDLQPASSYQRLLVHRCAEFYHLTLEPSQNSVAVIVTADSRMPSKRIAELVPPEESVLPAFQIMRRIDRSKAASRATSTDGNLTDDGEGSTKSQGSGSKKKQHMTMEERAAAYKEARSRIFMDFDEKDASASSNGAISSAASTVSYTGGSTGMSSVDGDGASTAPTESEHSGPAGRGKESWYSGPFDGSNGRVNQISGTSAVNTTLRSTAPPFTSPNVAPPPPKGTVHYIQPMAEAKMHQEMPSSMQQLPPGAPPTGSYATYPPPIFPYYMPYSYPFGFPQPVSFQPPTHGGIPPQEGQGQETQSIPQLQQQHPVPMPPGFGPPGTASISTQPYPGYVWMVAPAPSYIPVQTHAPMPPNIMAQPQPSSNVNISRPSSQASHIPFDPRSQHTGQGAPLQHPTPQQQHQQVQAYSVYHNQPNAFPAAHPQSIHNPVTPSRAPIQMHSAPPAMHVSMQNQHPIRPHGPPSASSFNSQHGPIGPSGQAALQPNGNGPWGNQGHSTGGSNGTAMSPRSQIRGNMPPPAAPGRSPPEGNWNLSGAGAPGGLASPKRMGSRTSWASYSYGPGVGVGGLHTVNPSNANGVGQILRAPDGLKIRVLPPITLDGHSTGSSNGSSCSARKRNVANGSGNIKPPGDETSSVTSSSSSSSKRTYTSTASSQPPQHHPLPERPDWVLDARPQPGGGVYNRSKATSSSNNSSSRSLLQPAGTGPLVASATPSPMSNPGQLSSTSSSVSGGGSDPLSKEFPPLVNEPKTPSRATPSGAWTNAGSTKAAVGGAGPDASPSRAGSTNTRFDEPDKKFERPPVKTGSALFNPRVAGPTRSKSRDSTQASAGVTDDLSRALAAVSLKDDEQKEPLSEGAEVDTTSGMTVVC